MLLLFLIYYFFSFCNFSYAGPHWKPHVCEVGSLLKDLYYDYIMIIILVIYLSSYIFNSKRAQIKDGCCCCLGLGKIHERDIKKYSLSRFTWREAFGGSFSRFGGKEKKRLLTDHSRIQPLRSRLLKLIVHLFCYINERKQQLCISWKRLMYFFFKIV